MMYDKCEIKIPKNKLTLPRSQMDPQNTKKNAPKYKVRIRQREKPCQGKVETLPIGQAGVR